MSEKVVISVKIVKEMDDKLKDIAKIDMLNKPSVVRNALLYYIKHREEDIKKQN